MIADWIVYVCLFLGLMTALVAGGLLIFSELIMPSLVRSEPKAGIEAMQHINRVVFRTVFLTSFLLLIPVSIGFAIYAWLYLSGEAQRLIIVAAVIYVPTVFVVTAAGNVPINERLDKLDHTSADAAAYWDTYGRVWIRWNHVRTIGSIATAGCYLFVAVTLAGQ